MTLRFAFPDDATAISRLASLDSAESPTGQLLLAEVAGELRAALSLRDGRVVADPFHRTAALVALLRERAMQLTTDAPRVRPRDARAGFRLALRRNSSIRYGAGLAR